MENYTETLREEMISLKYKIKTFRINSAIKQLENEGLQKKIEHLKKVNLELIETNNKLRQSIATSKEESKIYSI